MTDFERMLVLLKPVAEMALVADQSARQLLVKNQNSPPLGEADESFTEESWTACRDILDACQLISILWEGENPQPWQSSEEPIYAHTRKS